ncbi:hypothetical protein XENTR_v10004946 [Xenopus tropicalis]|nr:hypothetical protein XENTR_v10004946 [Xenopus tropicalis]
MFSFLIYTQGLRRFVSYRVWRSSVKVHKSSSHIGHRGMQCILVRKVTLSHQQSFYKKKIIYTWYFSSCYFMIITADLSPVQNGGGWLIRRLLYISIVT